MKIGGEEIQAKYRSELTIHRPETEELPERNYQFVLEAADISEFEKRFPDPEPPTKTVKGEQLPDFENEEYNERLQERITHRMHWIIIKTMAPSNIEWDSVKEEDPDTYELWEKDLLNAGFTRAEVNRLTSECYKVNGFVTNERIKDAVKNS